MSATYMSLFLLILFHLTPIWSESQSHDWLGHICAYFIFSISSLFLFPSCFSPFQISLSVSDHIFALSLSTSPSFSHFAPFCLSISFLSFYRSIYLSVFRSSASLFFPSSTPPSIPLFVSVLTSVYSFPSLSLSCLPHSLSPISSPPFRIVGHLNP